MKLKMPLVVLLKFFHLASYITARILNQFTYNCKKVSKDIFYEDGREFLKKLDIAIRSDFCV